MSMSNTMQLNEEDQRILMEREDTYQNEGLRLVETWANKPGMELGNGVLEEMMDKDVYKALSLVKFLENTENSLVKNLREYQTSSYMGITPQEVVKVFRFMYGNSVAPDLFNFFAMSSTKDVIYKIENTYTKTSRGATAGDITYETYGDGGRYTRATGEATFTGDGSTTNFTGTLPTVPALANSFQIWGAKGLIARDDGAGNLSATNDDVDISGTINYTTGAYDFTYGTAVANGEVQTIDYTFDQENENLFDEINTVSLNLKPYSFDASFHSLEASWHRFTEEVSESKLGRSARQDLIDSLADVARKSQDEFYCKQAVRQAGWTSPVTFNTDFSAQGADSDYSNAQALFSEFENAQTKTYDALGRYPARVNLLVGAGANAYLRKLKGYTVDTSADRSGFFKAGDVAGYNVYVAPKAVVDTNKIYLIGKGRENLSTDSVLSVGMYKGQVTSDQLEFSNFKNQLGIGVMSDHRIMNPKMISSITLSNL